VWLANGWREVCWKQRARARPLSWTFIARALSDAEKD